MELTEMSKLNRKQIRKMLLREFKMIGMGNMDTIGDAPMGMSMHGHSSDYLEPEPVSHSGAGHQGSVSKEDCCRAVLCLIECCDCPETKALLKECCEDILSRC